MKILQVCPDYPPWAMGGAPRAFRQLAESWHQSGHEVTVVCSLPESRSSEPSLPADYRIEPYRLWDLPPALREASYLAPTLAGEGRRFRHFVTRESPTFDAVIVHGLLETLPRQFLLQYPRAQMRKVISVQYGILSADYHRLLHFGSRVAHVGLGKLLISRLENIVVFSSTTGSELHSYFGALEGKRVRRLVLGIDPTSFASDYASVTERPTEVARWLENRSIQRPFLFAIGRNDPAKGFDILLESFRQLAEQFPTLTLVLAGDRTQFTDVLERMIRTYGLQDRVTMLGRVSPWESMSLFATCQVFVIPSRKEGYGLNAVMARVLSKPTVATATGAHEEILGGHSGSRIVTPGDVPRLTEALRAALLGPSPPITLDPERLASFDIHALADQLLQLVPVEVSPPV